MIEPVLIGNTIQINCVPMDISGTPCEVSDPKIRVLNKEGEEILFAIPAELEGFLYRCEIIVPGYNMFSQIDEPMVIEFSGMLEENYPIVERLIVEREWARYDNALS